MIVGCSCVEPEGASLEKETQEFWQRRGSPGCFVCSTKRDENAPERDGNATKWDETIPEWDGNAPERDGNATKWDETAPERDETIPERDGNASERDGNAPKQDESTQRCCSARELP